MNPVGTGEEHVIQRDKKGRFLPGVSAHPQGNSNGTSPALTRIKNVFINAFEKGEKGKEIIEEFRDSLSKRDKKIFIDWLVQFSSRNGHSGNINVTVVNQVVVDLSEIVKKHVKDPIIRNRIAEDLRRLGG